MNKIVNKFLLAGDKFILELNLRQPVFTGCGPLTKYRGSIKKFKITSDLNHICKNELYKTCLLMMQHILIAKICLK